MKTEKRIFEILISTLNEEIINTFKYYEIYYNCKNNEINFCLGISKEDKELMLKAFEDKIIINLAKIIDNHKDSKGIFFLLNLINTNSYLINGNKEIIEYINNELNNYYDLIKKIRLYRDKYLVHIDREFLYKRDELMNKIVIDLIQLKELLDSLKKILDMIKKNYSFSI